MFPFKFNDNQLSITNKLSGIIAEQINLSNSKSIPFVDFMQYALYTDNLGYYMNSLPKFGRDGDFTTAPLISSLFAKALAGQIQELFENNLERNIIEFGAGNGQLMLDLFDTFGDSIRYLVIESSPYLQEYQYQQLKAKFPQYLNCVTWCQELPENTTGAIIANEVLDALPCHKVRWVGDTIYQLMVMFNSKSNGFYYSVAPSDIAVRQSALKLPIPHDNYTSEINLKVKPFLTAISRKLINGAVIFIDYGYGESEYYSQERNNGTLRGFLNQHLVDDVLVYPGLLDITSSVNFTQVATTGIDLELDLIGYTTQANFLINCGITNYLSQYQDNMTSYLRKTNEVNQLASPNELGEAFKVIMFSKNLDFDELSGFASGDKTYQL